MIEIDAKFIEEWEKRYDEIENDEGEYQELVKIVKKEVEEEKCITKETFIRILNWKSPRAKGHVKWDQFELYKAIFKEIADPKHPYKMEKLTVLRGIGAPVASTILHFIYPHIYPIYDFRTVEILNHFGYIYHKTCTPANYPEFLNAIYRIKDKVKIYTLRQIDRALFAFHKINF